MSNNCMNCADRCVGCHSTCEIYKAFRAERDELNSKKNKNRVISLYHVEKYSENYEKFHKKKRTCKHAKFGGN